MLRNALVMCAFLQLLSVVMPEATYPVVSADQIVRSGVPVPICDRGASYV